MDKRIRYIMILDTETTNTITNPNGTLDMSNVLVYDCGWAIVDKKGNVYETASYVNRDIFCYEQELMRTAYYADKIPRYLQEIESGSRILADNGEIRSAMLDCLRRWNCATVCAHNARFDNNALNKTEAYVTKSFCRYWFPFGAVEWWDTMLMADTICKQKSYIAWCKKNGYMTKQGRPRKTAEILYRYITGNHDFEESHTGLEDVLIEKEILAHCFRQHKKMRKQLFDPSKYPAPPAATDFQISLLCNLKKEPMLRL